MAGLTTHVLDTARGRPAAGVEIRLTRLTPGGGRELLKTALTNEDGRTDEPLLAPGEAESGEYEIVFDVGSYFARYAAEDAETTETTGPPFLSRVPVRFGLAEPDAHYHVPLLVSPYSYTTYRGS